MGVKHSFKQILTLMTSGQTYMRCLSAMLAVIIAVQLAVVPASASLWETGDSATEGDDSAAESTTLPTEPALKNTFALVVSTGGQPGDAVQYFKVIYEDEKGIRRSEYILKEDHSTSFAMAQEFGNGNERRQKADSALRRYGQTHVTLTDIAPLQTEQRDTYLFETFYDVQRILGVEIMHNAGQWDCQGLWVYQVDQIYGEEMYGYISDDFYISFSGWRLAELEARYDKNGVLTYTTLQNSRPKLYRMGENGHPEYNLITYDRNEAPYDSAARGKEYAMRLDITDVYGAGIENFDTGYTNGNGQKIIRDALEMEIRYQDTFGCVQTVSARVLSSSYIWALDNGVSETAELAGYAQQGDTLLFPVKIPFFADLLEVSLTYSWGYTEAYLATAPMVSVTYELTDELSLSAISMYDMTLSIADVSVDPERAAIVPTITYNPIYLWTTGSRQGYVLTAGDPDEEPYGNVPITKAQKIPFEMRLNEDSVAMVDEPLVDEYLVEITTDQMPSAATTGDISVMLNYVTYNGVEQRTEKIMLREQSKDFHGYTPGADDMYYWMGMRPGGKLYFRISIPYVGKFTSATFALENGNNDEWQMSNLNIYRLDELSKRKVTWGDYSAGGLHSDRYYDRAFEGELVFSGMRSMLVQDGSSVELEIDENSGFAETILPDSAVSWSDIKYSMSYEEALQDIGFTKTRNTYQVEVTVAGNNALAGTEDAGSKNQFYFQLVFQDGNSAYVLANQQLSADGFRAGYTETFTVKTNQDYGELAEVRIIPEDISSKSDQFDKLNIESIQVIRRSDGGLSRQWSVERVGWIDIDYRDEGAANSMLGQSGRTEEEMVRSFYVTYSTYAVNLLFSMTTLAMPFSGTVYGDICYYNSAGEAKHKAFDIVELMYDYANKTPRYNSSVSADGNISTSGSAWSDTYMFRADHTDRFIVTLSDARELAYLDIDAYMDGLEQGQGGTWHIGGVAVSLIESDGSLLLNANDEYERDNAVRLLTTNVDTNRTPAYQLLMEHNAMTSQRIRFIENKIDLDINRGSVSVLSREPISQNDVLNIYVYPNLDKSEPSTDYTLKAAVTYTSPRGMRQASAGDLRLSDDGTMFYMIGVSAPGMTVLNELNLQADHPKYMPVAYMDRAVVQQVRSGVVINTYEFDFSDGSAAYGLSDVPLSELSGYSKAYIDEQVVMLSIGKGLDEPIMLQPETKDLAVALTYISDNTPVGYEKEYDSPFIYLTDQQISMLRSGQTVSVTFTEGYIKEITGLVLVATGGLSIPVDMACVGTYSVSGATGERVERQWYSFSKFVDGISGTEVARADRHLGYSGDSVKPLKLQFVTAPATVDAESGVNGSVEMTISYVDDYGTIRTKKIPDLRIHATSETPFATDSVTDVELLVSGMKELRWLEVRPYDDRSETNVGWKLSSVSAQLGLTGEVQKRSVDDTKMITENAGRRINFSSIYVEVIARAQSNTGKPTTVEAQNETVSMLLDSGQAAVLSVFVNDSYEGYDVTVERTSGMDSSAAADASDFLTESANDTLIFNPGNNYTGANIYYRITVTSREVGSKSVINIVHTFEKEPEPVILPTEPGTEGGTGATGGGSESAPEGGTDVTGGGSESAPEGGTDVTGGGSESAPEGGTDVTGGGSESAPEGGTDVTGGGSESAPESGTDVTGGGSESAPESGTDVTGGGSESAPESGADATVGGNDAASGGETP